MRDDSLRERIHAVVRRIPRGRVATYGQVAALAGIGRQPRLVGYALAALPDDTRLPWHRVVNAQGRVSPRATPGYERLQAALLEREGVRFDARGRIDLATRRWRDAREPVATAPRDSYGAPRRAARRTGMAQQRWLVKSEPSTYSFDDLVRDGGTRWDGVRNAQARLHLAAMKPGDAVLVYHSGDEKAVIGLAKVTRAAYPDPTADDPRWLAVDLAPGKRLAQPVPLARIKADPKLATIALVRQSRLSVMPLDADAWERIVALGAKKPAR